MYDDLVIATITLARSAREHQLMLEGIAHLSALAVAPIIAVDGGSDAAFIEALRQIPTVSVAGSPVPGLLAQVRESLQRARETGRPYILYTEANKAQFFAGQLSSFLARARVQVQRDPGLGMVLPSRSTNSFATFPTFQQYTETVVNDLVQQTTGRAPRQDYTYGPRLLASSLVPALEQVSADLGWGWMTYLLVIAHRLGQGVYTEPMDLPCPPDERIDTDAERLLRLTQLGNHVAGLAAALRQPFP